MGWGLQGMRAWRPPTVPRQPPEKGKWGDQGGVETDLLPTKYLYSKAYKETSLTEVPIPQLLQIVINSTCCSNYKYT